MTSVFVTSERERERERESWDLFSYKIYDAEGRNGPSFTPQKTDRILMFCLPHFFHKQQRPAHNPTQFSVCCGCVLSYNLGVSSPYCGRVLSFYEKVYSLTLKVCTLLCIVGVYSTRMWTCTLLYCGCVRSSVVSVYSPLL